MSVESMIWALRYADLPPREKLLLIGIASHDGDGGAWPSEATLAEYVGTSDRHVRRLIASLVEHGFLTVHVNQGGTKRTRGDRRPNLYELHRPEITIPASRVDISVTTGGHFEQERVDIQTSTESSSETPCESSKSSSLRSEELSEQVVENASGARETKPKAPKAEDPTKTRARELATAYWDWHKAETGGPPAETFQSLMSVAKACLTRQYGDDEILDAMKQEPWTLTAKRVIGRVGLAARERENRPSTAAIPSAVVKAMLAAKPWLSDRWPELPTGPNWAVLMEDVARLVKIGYGIGETMIRLAVAMRDPDYGGAFWLMNVDIPRFNGGLADYPHSMEAAYQNRGWRV